MPGTGLAREQKPAVLFVWNKILPVIAKMLPGASTPKKSADMMARIITGHRKLKTNGEYIEFTGETLTPWQPENADIIGEELLSESDNLLAPWLKMLRKL